MLQFITKLTLRFLIMLMVESLAIFSFGCGIFNTESNFKTLQNKYNAYVEERLATMDEQGNNYIYVELCVSSDAPRKRVSYFIYELEKKYYIQKTTTFVKYQPVGFSNFAKFANKVEKLKPYDWSSDTTIKYRAVLTHFIYYKVSTNLNRNKKDFELLYEQVLDNVDVPGCDLIREFIMEAHWVDMREQNIKD